MKRKLLSPKKIIIALTSVIIGFNINANAADKEVNVYSYRQEFLVKPIFKAFTKKTGIKVNVIFAKKGLIDRIVHEDKNSPADVLLTSDISSLEEAVKKNITQPISTKELEKLIPDQYRDADNNWFGLTRRARVIYASKDRVKQKELSYEELADPKWKGRICIRSGNHVYNIALVSSIIAHKGEVAAKKWLQKVKANLARKPNGNDRAQVKGIYSGECDIAVANSYYMGKMLTNDKNPEQKKWANAVRIIFPKSKEYGTHVNISGIALTKNSPNKVNAIKLMEYMASDEAQKIYAEVNFEYPIRKDIEWSNTVKSWGTFKADQISLNEIGKLAKKASKLIDEVRFNE